MRSRSVDWQAGQVGTLGAENQCLELLGTLAAHVFVERHDFLLCGKRSTAAGESLSG